MHSRYVREQGWNLYAAYCDDGVSGTTFDRPMFNQMIADARAGKINLILCKDLSRLGRDYIEAGRYTDIVFLSMGCRFIALNDGVDTIHKNNEILVILKNVMNDLYARDTSSKIRAVKQSTFRTGKYVGCYAPIGYRKSPADKHILEIDPVTAPVVLRWTLWRVSSLLLQPVYERRQGGLYLALHQLQGADEAALAGHPRQGDAGLEQPRRPQGENPGAEKCRQSGANKGAPGNAGGGGQAAGGTGKAGGVGLLYARFSNEWYAKDTSKKIRAVFRNKGMSGQRLSTNAPYGYTRAEDGHLLIDEETAPVVELIFQLCVEGNGPGKIARMLRERGIPTPGTIEFQRTGRTRRYHPDDPCRWTHDTVADILEQDAYLGRTTNFKTAKLSYKSKKKIANPPEKWVCSPGWPTAPTAAQSCTIAGRLLGHMNRSATPARPIGERRVALHTISGPWSWSGLETVC